LSESELLDLRVRNLKVRIDGTPLEERVDELYRELEAKGIRFRPHCWLSDEWFAPDGFPGLPSPSIWPIPG